MQIVKHTTSRAGQMLIELLLVIALLMVVLPALLGGFVASREGRVNDQKRFNATLLLREAKTAMLAVREASWNAVSTNGVYHPTITSGVWGLASGPDTVDGFTRSITIADVQRSSSGNIVVSGGTVDPSTKELTLQISWDGGQHEVSSTMYVTRFLDNAGYEQTSQADFTTGTFTSTTATATGGGQVQLSANVKGKWCSPNLSGATVDLPASPNAIWAEQGHIYTASGHNATSTEISYEHTTVSNTDPPVGTLQGIFKGYKTYDVWADSNYAYLATSDNGKEMVIVNNNQFSNQAQKIFAESGYFNASGRSDGNSVFVLGDRAYLAAGNYLYVVDISSKTGSRPEVGTRIQFANSGDYAGKIYAIEQGGSRYVYVSVIGSTPDELKILNVTNPNVSSQWKMVGGINIEPNGCSSLESGKSVFVNPAGTRAYVSSVNDNNFKEFFTIDTSNKAAPSMVGGFATNPPCTNGGGYEAGGMDPSQSTVVNASQNRAILVGNDATGDAINSQEYQVLDMTDEAHPIKCGGLDFNQGINGVAAVSETDGDVFAYIITGDSATDVKIIAGGPDGTYPDQGTFESSTFDAGSNAVFNAYTATFSTPAGTSLKWQVAIRPAIAGSCNGVTYSYVGPDGTSSSYFTNPTGQLPMSSDGVGFENPGQCLRYKVTFSTTNSNVTPTLDSMFFNYSP